MNLKNYQEKNVQKLVSSIIEQLEIDGMRRTIVFQAPTGAGKTVMMTEALCRLNEEIADSNCQYSQVAFIWVAPNGLHIQSYQSMRNAFTETQRLSPVVYDELDTSFDGYIKPGEVFFVNWQSIYSDKNVIVRGGEQTPSIYEIIEKTTREHNIPIVCIIDEEHMFTGKNAKQSENVLSDPEYNMYPSQKTLLLHAAPYSPNQIHPPQGSRHSTSSRKKNHCNHS